MWCAATSCIRAFSGGTPSFSINHQGDEMKVVGRIIVGFLALVGALSIGAVILASTVAPIHFTVWGTTVQGPVIWRTPPIKIAKIDCGGDLTIKSGEKFPITLTLVAPEGAQAGRTVVFDPEVNPVGDESTDKSLDKDNEVQVVPHGKTSEISLLATVPSSVSKTYLVGVNASEPDGTVLDTRYCSGVIEVKKK